jgi:hypothetical protein
MHKITRQAAIKFRDSEPFGSGNTRVVVDYHPNDITSVRLYLHGNQIAYKIGHRALHVRLAGWNTPTTRERLNGLLEIMGKPIRFCQQRYLPYLRNIENGEMIEIDDNDWIMIT